MIILELHFIGNLELHKRLGLVLRNYIEKSDFTTRSFGASASSNSVV